MSFEAFAEKNRTLDLTVTLTENDGTTSVTLAADDVVRFKMGRRPGALPDLDIDSAGATANGSKVTIDERGPSPAASVTIRLAQGDTVNLVPTVYDAEVTVVDNSETAPVDAIKHAEFGTVHLEETLGGSIGLT